MDLAEANPVELAHEELLNSVFVSGGLPWRALRQSFLAHTFAVAAIVGLSQSPLLRSRAEVEPRDPFQHTTITYYRTSEFLPAFELRADVDARQGKPDPVKAPQNVESIARRPESRRQTIIAPPEVRLDQDVALPNVLATNPYLPPVPLDSVSHKPLELPHDVIQAVQPPPQVVRDSAARRMAVSGNLAAVGPSATLAVERTRAALPIPAAVEPPIDAARLARRPSELTIAKLNATAIDPALPVPDQRAFDSMARESAAAGRGGLLSAGADAAVPPSVTVPGGGTRSVVVLNLEPSAMAGEIRVPNATRAGSFAASPSGRDAGTGQPSVDAPSRTGNQIASLRVGDPPRQPANVFAAALAAPLAVPERVVVGARPKQRNVNDEIAPIAAKVFGGRQYYSMIVNMPNLASSTGSWVVRYAALDKLSRGVLSAPVAERKVDPGYPADLRYEGVEGRVVLYAVIGVDGVVRDVRVLEGLHQRLDENARTALARWHFRPGTREGQAVAVEAVVQISFAAAAQR